MTATTDQSLTVTPLGGLGEVGMNMMVYEAEGQRIIVDAGVLFPNADMPGIDMVFPDLSYLKEQQDRFLGLFLTHGHEDHIGAVPFLLRTLNLPIYGTPVTLALLREKLKEHGLHSKTTMHTVNVREKVKTGPFEVEFIRVTHSILDAAALAIRSPAGVIIHTGDFKIDPTPVDNKNLDVERFTAYGDEGVLALLSDSTNSEQPGHTRSESEVGGKLEALFAEIPGRIILATFSSNIHRVQQVIDAAMACDKKVAIIGRSMENNTRITREMGYLTIPPGALVTPDSLPDHPDTPIVILTTGSQGEPLSALSRMTLGEHRSITIQPGDTVMLSSRTIPGNEVAIGRVINQLYRMGADVVHARLSEIHVSGHAAKEEQEQMMDWVRPRHFVPIHGEWRHLVSHALTATTRGYATERTHIIENGNRLKLWWDGSERLSNVTAGRTFVDGNSLHGEGQLILRDRRNLSSGGILVVVVGLNMKDGTIILGPELLNRGFVADDQMPALTAELTEVATGAVHSLEVSARADSEVVKTRVRNRLRRYIERNMRRRPIVLPMILEM